MRALVPLLACLVASSSAIAAGAEDIASIAWSHTAVGPGWGLPAYLQQCFYVEVDGGPGARMAEGVVSWGDSGTHRTPLPFALDEHGRGEATLCHGFPPQLIGYLVSLSVRLEDGRRDVDCIEVHGQLGTNEPDPGCAA